MLSVKHGRLSIAMVCVVLGFMLAVQFRSASDMQKNVSYQRVEELSERLLQTEKERDNLRAELKQIQSDGTAAGQVEASLAMRAGSTAVTGPGVTVIVNDSGSDAKAGENPNLYLVHDDDLLRVINELRAAGAEAISLNGQRLIGTSEIRCAGPTLSVNNVRSAPPYEIKAIGDINNLENALKMRGGVAETLKVWGIDLKITASDKLTVPAYEGTMQFKYAQPTQEGK